MGYRRIFFRYTVIIFFVIFAGMNRANSQSDAGNEAFAVMSLHNSAQTTARGLGFMPGFSDDIAASLTNPSVLNSSLNNKGTVTYTDLFAGANQAALAFDHTFDKIGNLGSGLQYINYGTFKMTEANGDVTGEFHANEFMFTVGWGTRVERNLYVGVAFKPLFSVYESYNSFSIAFDFAATYADSAKSWQASAIVKNLGRQIHSFHSEKDSLPFDIQMGFLKKFAHAPVVLYVVADKLTKWNIREEDSLNPRDEVSFDGTVKKENKFTAFMDKGFRHLQFAVDIVPSDKWYISLGYSWRQRQEMKVDDAFSLAGISYGLGIKWKKFTLNYARNEYHNYGSPNYITLGYTF